MSFELAEPPALEPVSLAQLKARLRISHDEEDARLNQVISASRQRVEAECGLALIAQTWIERLDDWSQFGRLSAFGTRFRLGRAPVIAVESIRVFLTRGEASLWPESAYEIIAGQSAAWLQVKPGECFPTVGRSANGVELRYRAGFGASRSDVPPDLLEACCSLAEALYLDDVDAFPGTVQTLLQPWRRVVL